MSNEKVPRKMANRIIQNLRKRNIDIDYRAVRNMKLDDARKLLKQLREDNKNKKRISAS